MGNYGVHGWSAKSAWYYAKGSLDSYREDSHPSPSFGTRNIAYFEVTACVGFDEDKAGYKHIWEDEELDEEAKFFKNFFKEFLNSGDASGFNSTSLVEIKSVPPDSGGYPNMVVVTLCIEGSFDKEGAEQIIQNFMEKLKRAAE